MPIDDIPADDLDAETEEVAPEPDAAGIRWVETALSILTAEVLDDDRTPHEKAALRDARVEAANAIARVFRAVAAEAAAE